MTIEDETNCAIFVIFENLFEKYRKPIIQSRLIMIEGTLLVEGKVVQVIVSACYDFSRLLRQLTASRNEELPLFTLSRVDEKSIPAEVSKKM